MYGNRNLLGSANRTAEQLWGGSEESPTAHFLEIFTREAGISPEVDSALRSRVGDSRKVLLPARHRTSPQQDPTNAYVLEVILGRLTGPGVRCLWLSPDSAWGTNPKPFGRSGSRLRRCCSCSRCTPACARPSAVSGTPSSSI